MPEGPTTEGSIVAYLRLDSSDWNQKLDEAEARAKELGHTDPTIRVGADTGDAIAKLEAVRAAEASLGGGTNSVSSDKAANNLTVAQARLAAAERAAANAASSQYLAELRLADVQDKRGRTEYQVAAAEEAVARASRNAEAAELKHMAASTALKDAEEAAARAALESAAAQETEAGASDTAAKASSNAAASSVQNMQGQTYAILAAIALIGPLTSAVVGLGGAFVAEGAAGVAAVEGIKNEMASGSAVGLQYRTGLAQLKGDLETLESTAATGILDGFEKSVDTANSAMPQLNAFVGEFAGMLGQSGDNLLSGALDGLQSVEPLFREGAGILQQWTAEFASWAAAGGLNDFVSYAEANLPRVAVTLETLTKDAGALGTELAPLSTDILDIVNASNRLVGFVQWVEGLAKSVPVVGSALGTVGKIAGDVLNPIQGVEDAIGQIQPQIDQWTGATHAQQSAQDSANQATAVADATTQKLTDAQNTAKTATDQFAQALAGLGNVNLSATQASVAWQQSIADASTALQKNGATLDQNTQQGRDNTTALDNMAQSAVALIAAQAKAGTSAVTLTGNMQSARDSFVQTAMKMGDTAAQANALADQYGLIPKNVTTQFHTSGLDTAQAQVTAFQSQLDRIVGTYEAHVVVTTQNGGVAGGATKMFSTGGEVPQYRAAGGTIASYLASGGNPFQPRGTDTVAAMLTPGEFVVKERSASYDPQFMKAYNDDPAGAIAAKQRGAGGGVTVIISPKGGIDLTKYIDVRVQQGTRQAMGNLAQQINGGTTI